MDSEIEHALYQAEPLEALYDLATKWKEQEQTQSEIYVVFSVAHAFLQNADREVEADYVADIADCIVGCCAPHRKIFDTYLDT